MEETAYRYRLTFAKEETIRFTSHLNLNRAWERTFRRAGLPLAYRRGFNPRPRINIGSALPLGHTSDAELLDFWLETELNPDEILEALSRAAAPGMHIGEVLRIEKKLPALQTRIHSAAYTVDLDDPPSLTQIESAVEKLMAAPVLPRERRGKPYDLRPLIESLEVTQLKDGTTSLEMTLSAREGATGRPEEVLLALNIDPTFAQIRRTQLILVGNQSG